MSLDIEDYNNYYNKYIKYKNKYLKQKQYNLQNGGAPAALALPAAATAVRFVAPYVIHGAKGAAAAAGNLVRAVLKNPTVINMADTAGKAAGNAAANAGGVIGDAAGKAASDIITETGNAASGIIKEAGGNVKKSIGNTGNKVVQVVPPVPPVVPSANKKPTK